MVHVLVVTCKLVPAVKAVLAAEFAAKHVAWKLGSLGAMFGSIVSLQITKLLGEMVTVRLGALVSPLMFEMGSLVGAEHLAVDRFQRQQYPR